MITTSIVNSAKREFLEGVHQPDDLYKIALYDSDAMLGPDTFIYSGANEVRTENYVAGGMVLEGYSLTMDSGKAILSFADATWENVSVSARGAMIYNSSKGNKAVAVFDFGEEVTSTNGRFTASIPRANKDEGLIRIA